METLVLPTEYNSIEEFLKKGEEIFGTTDRKKWKFICPSCNKVTEVQEWIDYSSSKEEASSQIGFSCVGRLIKKKQRDTSDISDPIHKLVIGDMGAKDIYACNYTTGGLFNISPVRVKFVDEKDESFFQFHPD